MRVYPRTARQTNGAQNTAAQDRNAPLGIVKFNNITNSTTLTGEGAINDTEITVASNTGIVIGSYLIIFSPPTSIYDFANVLAINGNVITIDTPLDYAFEIGSVVDIAVTNIGTANGTLTNPVVFGIRGTGIPTGLDVTAIITRIMFHCHTDGPVDLTKFGDLAALANGLVLRTRNHIYKNIFNVKTNGELKAIMYDWDPSAAINPNQGVNGFTARFTLTRVGTTAQLNVGEDLELLVQDSFADLVLLEAIAEGYAIF